MLKKDSKLDELAYQYYLVYVANLSNNVFVHKWYFIENKDMFKEFYNQANRVLRKEKIEKINKNI